MNTPEIIKVEKAGVRFNLASEHINGLKEYIIKFIKGELIFQEFWALRDISLTVKKGEAWGILGVNGSGKSTLLKLICQILKPAEGTVWVNGTIAPLIELGAGIDGELTARENIYLNGAILGHSKNFMQEHFDEIVDFSELHQFLDTPVKNFSSGMAARLGFSIATVIQPDILIVDEILSVGDIAFQRKCEDRMQHMLENGATLLYVSHSIDAIKSLCTNAIWLDHGSMIASGPVEEVSEKYLESQSR